MLNNWLNKRQLKKWAKKIQSEYDPIQELKKLTDADFSTRQALAIMNYVANYISARGDHNA